MLNSLLLNLVPDSACLEDLLDGVAAGVRVGGAGRGDQSPFGGSSICNVPMRWEPLEVGINFNWSLLKGEGIG